MKDWRRNVLVVICFLISMPVFSYGETYKIGVLAKNGPVKALKKWKSTGEYLTEKLAGKSFEIIPLSFDAVNGAIQSGAVDFFLVNSSMYVTAKVRYGASAIATMINSRQGQPLQSFGGVIFTLAENEDINSLVDLKGKTFMAVKKSSFGGWQMAYKELLDGGIDPNGDFAKLEFGGKHDNVVYAVINGAVDAGTVRTDTIERMVAADELDMDELKIINQKKYNDFPFVCSTRLYPEWPLAKLAHVGDDLASEVVAVLKELKSTDKAAKDAKIVGWRDSLDYGPVEELQKVLKIGVYSGQ
ncbi:phosphate/phosphite/phosphonate ABC transporter substrate-binding protein [Desulfomarina sp.]